MQLALFTVLLTGLISCSTTPEKKQIEGNPTTNTFSKAKKLLAGVYSNGGSTFYCGCSFKGKTVDWKACGYKAKSKTEYGIKRAKRIEWEHIVPASTFGQKFPEWTKKCKRDCVARKNKRFAKMYSDLYNLVPAIGEINGRRSNYPMAIIEGELREFGKCNAEVKAKQFEPRPEVRGDIARVYLYMDGAYSGLGIVNEKNRELMLKWNQEDPPSKQECVRAKAIEKIQGNSNHILKKLCK